MDAYDILPHDNSSRHRVADLIMNKADSVIDWNRKDKPNQLFGMNCLISIVPNTRPTSVDRHDFLLVLSTRQFSVAIEGNRQLGSSQTVFHISNFSAHGSPESFYDFIAEHIDPKEAKSMITDAVSEGRMAVVYEAEEAQQQWIKLMINGHRES